MGGNKNEKEKVWEVTDYSERIGYIRTIMSESIKQCFDYL